MSIFNLKHNSTFMSLFTHHLYISQWKICLLHIASWNNISKNGSSTLFCILSSILEFCILQVVHNVASFTFSGNKERCTLENMHTFSKHTVCNFACFKVLTIYLLQTLHIPHCTATTLLYFIKHSFYRKVPNKPSKVQRSMLYTKCAQIF